MTDTLRTPWILDHLISIAEQYGGNLSAVPRTEKLSRVQLVKFLTFAPPGSTEPCVIWADVSDKKHFMHARLSIDAIERYMRDPMHAGASITSHKSAFVRLRKVRPAFGRVARREVGGGMTKEPRLYLDVDEIDLLGAYGEAMWGAPVDIAQDPNIREWMFGLQEDGGGGNVLKLRKERLLAQAAERADQLQENGTDTLRQTTINAMDIKVQVARKSAAHKPRPSTDSVSNRPVPSKEAVRRASWKRLHTNMMKYFRPPDDVYEELLLLCVYAREPTSVPETGLSPRRKSRSSSRSRSAAHTNGQHSVRCSASPERLSKSPTNRDSPARTPSHWSPSVQGTPCPAHKSDNEPPGAEDDEDDDLFKEDSDASMDEEAPIHSRAHSPEVGMDVEEPPAAERGSSPKYSMPMPEPAQPRVQPPPSSMPSVPYASSPPRASSPAAHKPSKGTFNDIDTLPPSSFPASSYRLPPSPTSSPRPTPMTPAYPVPVVRRVPLPQYNLLRRDPDASGEGRVLVENSDTASPGSQRPSQSQSQSQNHDHSQAGSHGTSHSDGDRSQSQGQPQSQRPSQLRNEIASAMQPEQDPLSGVAKGSEEGTGSVTTGEAPVNAGESQESQGQPQGRSQQSLSYKGDSQSQEGAAASPWPDVSTDEPIENVAPPETQAVADGEPSAAAGRDNNQPPQAGEPPLDSPVPGQRPPSPMAVDESQGAAPSAPGWAAIATADDSEDSQTEVDELLSDPLLAVNPNPQPHRRGCAAPRLGPTKMSARKTAVQARTGAGTSLEPDDERTAAMIDQYMLAQYTEKVQKVIDARKRSAEQATTPRPQEVCSSASERAEKRRRTESNEVESEAGPSVPSQPLSHDPSIWAAPAFMRRAKAQETTAPTKTHAPPSEKVKVEPASPVRPFATQRERKPQARKRTARPSSPSLDLEQSPAKKRKTSAAAVPVPVLPFGGDSQTKASHLRYTSKQPGSRLNTFVHVETSKTKTSLPRLVSLAPSSQPAARASSTIPHLHTGPVAGPSSRGSSRVPRVPEEGSSRSTQGVSHAQPPAGRQSIIAKGKSVPPASPSRESKSADLSARPTNSRNVSSTSEAQSNLRSTSRVAGSSSRGVGKSHGGSAAPAESSREARAPLLGGLEFALEPTRTPDGPPLLGWDEILQILLKTGKARFHREQHAKEKDRDGGK